MPPTLQVRHDDELPGVAAGAERRARVVDERVVARLDDDRQPLPDVEHRDARGAVCDRHRPPEARGRDEDTILRGVPGSGSGDSAASVPSNERHPGDARRARRSTTWPSGHAAGTSISGQVASISRPVQSSRIAARVRGPRRATAQDSSTAGTISSV